MPNGSTETFGNAGYSFSPLTSGTTSTGNDFGDFQDVTISGFKFNDVDGNPHTTGDDVPLCGWVIHLSFDETELTTTTDVNGFYHFDNLGPGTYSLSEDLQSGWMQTFAPEGSITTQSGQSVSNEDFGNFKLITISGTKFENHDGDGGRAPGDEGLSGWVIKLDGTTTATTDANGNYSFTDVGPGTHTVQEVLQSGWTQTKGGPGAGGVYTVVAQSGDNILGEDFGNFKLVTISGTKFEDHNGNGIRNLPTDEGLSGWLIQLDGVVMATTGANGNYSISGVGPGTHKITEVLQSGWTQTKGGGGPGGAYQVATSSGVNVSGDDFGNFKLVTISGISFEDHNGSGVLEPGDEGLSGWVIRLDGQVKATTDANGNYSIAGVGPGNHVIQEVTQTGFTETLGRPFGFFLTTSSGVDISSKNFGNFTNVTFSGTAFDDHNGNTVRDPGDQGLAGFQIMLDGKVVATTGAMGNYTITNIGPGIHSLREILKTGWSGTLGRSQYAFATASGVNVTRDFGNFLNVTLSGEVFEDHKGNSILDPGDEGLAGWQILLDGRVAATTDANGHYSISGVTSGLHSFVEVNQAGFTQTLGAAGYAFTTTSGVNPTRNFGDFKNITVSGVVFYDKNGNGVQDSGEPGLAGFVIRVVGNNAVLTATTGPNGTYSIPGVGPGDQTIIEVPNVGFTQTSKSPPTSRTMSGVNVSANFGDVMIGQGGGKSISFWLSASGEALYNSADLSGLNLVQNNGSPFVPGSYASFRTWLLGSATSGNNAYQLSAQLAVAQLDVDNHFIDPTESVFTGAIPEAAHLGALVNSNGYVNIQALINNANSFLGNPANDNTVASSPARTYEEALKLVLQATNNNFKVTVLPPGP